MAHSLSSPYASSHSLHGTTHVNSNENFPASSSGPKPDADLTTVAATLPPHTSPISRRNTLRGRANSRAITPRTGPTILPPQDPTEEAFKKRQNYSHHCERNWSYLTCTLLNLPLTNSSRPCYPSFDMGVCQGHVDCRGFDCYAHVGYLATLLGFARAGSKTWAKLPRLGRRLRRRRNGSFCNSKRYELDNGGPKIL